MTLLFLRVIYLINEVLFDIYGYIIKIIPFKINQLNYLLIPATLYRSIIRYKRWPEIVHFKKSINCSTPNFTFIYNHFTRISLYSVLSKLIRQYPETFHRYFIIRGESFVTKLQKENKGVLIIGNHGTPWFLQSFVFSNYFKTPISSYSHKGNLIWLSKRISFSKRNRFEQESPIYWKGEEKKVVQALTKGEWINMLIDIPLWGRPVNCVLACKPLPLTEFPFRISLKYNISLLFIGLKRSLESNRLIVEIIPMENFNTPNEGLQQYVSNFDDLITEDNYANHYLTQLFKSS